MLQWYYLALISSVLMGVATIIEKKTLQVEHATAYSSAFSWLIAIISLIFLPFANFNMTAYQLALLYIVSLITSVTYLSSARMFKHSELSVISSTTSSLPSLFIVILAFVFLSEHLTPIQYVSIIGMVVTTFLILFKVDIHSKMKPFESNKYRNMVLTNSLLSAIGAIMMKYVLGGVDVFAYLIVTQIFMAINFAIFISVKYNGIKEIAETVREYKTPILAIVLLTICYRITYFFAVSAAPISLNQPLRNTLYVVITVVFAGELFKEENIAQKLLLGLLMILFAYLLIV